VDLDFVGRSKRDQDAERDEAAVASAEAVASPKPAEDVVDADLQELVAELAVAEVELTCIRQQFAEDLKTLFTYICHANSVARGSSRS